MKSKKRLRQIAIAGLMLGLAVVTLGCRGPRYGLVLREDLSAELWRFPTSEACPCPPCDTCDMCGTCGEGGSDCENVCQAACQESFDEELAGAGSECGPRCPDCSPCPDGSPCPETICARGPRLFGRCGCHPRLGARLRGGGVEEEAEPVEEPPMIASRFFPVPTRPVFTPRGDLSNLNPYFQGPTPEQLPPGESSPLSPPPTPTPTSSEKSSIHEPSMLNPSAPRPLPLDGVPDVDITPIAARPNWVFSAPESKSPPRNVAMDLIATGSQRVE